MSRVRIKICGVTRPEDAASAASLGADAIGMVFVPDSKRCVSRAGQASAIVAALPPLVTPVALFFNQPQSEVEAVLREVPEVTLQFQGDESAAFCRSFGRPYLKGVRMAPGPGVQSILDSHSDAAAAFLFDAFKPGVSGGTGEAFDWSQLAPLQKHGKPWFLAGGLHAGNAAEALRHRPWGLDLASGVERQPGIKDDELMAAFFQAVAAGSGNRNRELA